MENPYNSKERIPGAEGFLAAQEIRELIARSRLVWDGGEPLDYKQMLERQGASLELRLGDEYYLSGDAGPKYLSDGCRTLAIPGGQFALLTTRETIAMPDDCIALISMKTSVKIRGLINISGFHVDPRFRGKIHYAVFNAGPNDIILERNQRLFQMFLVKLRSVPEEEYLRPAQASRGELRADDIAYIHQRKPLSLHALDERIDKLTTQVTFLLAVAVALFTSIFAALIPLVIEFLRRQQ